MRPPIWISETDGAEYRCKITINFENDVLHG